MQTSRPCSNLASDATDAADCAVVGAGPAALLAACALAERGVGVVVVAPSPREDWRPRFGVWAGELVEALDGAVKQIHQDPVVRTIDQSIALPRPYAELSTPLLQERLTSKLESLGGKLVDARVATIAHDGGLSVLHTSEGPQSARIVVDASGGQSTFTRRKDRALGFQTALGVTVELVEPPADGRMSLMDWRPVPSASSGKKETLPPTFLYALPQPSSAPPNASTTRRWFLEETGLVDREPHAFAALEERLFRRIKSQGLLVREIVDEERCLIRMGGGIPERGQRIIPFGAAAGLVHPATGYQLAASARLAPQLAEAIVLGLAQADPHAAARLAFDAIWTPDRQRRWDLFHFGMVALVRLDEEAIRAFIGAFFGLPTDDWSGYLSGEASFAALRKTMTRLFVGVPWSLKLSLLQQGVMSPVLRHALLPQVKLPRSLISNAFLAAGSL